MASASIIVCTRDRAESLKRTLAALDAVDVPAGMSAEVIVVDNGSRDHTAAVVRDARPGKMSLKYVLEPRAGQSHARNRGMAESTGEVIIFTDDDVIHAADWLGQITAPILNGTADAVVGSICLAPHLVKPWMTPAHRAWLADTSGLDARQPGRMVGANMAFSRAVLDRVPAFDVELGPGAIGFGDDTLFSQQLKAAGFRIASAFGAAVEHHFLEDRLLPGQWLSSARRMGHADAYMSYHWENSVWPHPYRMVCTSFVHLVRHRLRAMLSKNGPHAAEAYLVALRSFHAPLQYLHERKRARNYTRYGLVKIAGENAASRSEAAAPLQFASR
jgi:glycosyltransferase involved in cell wall biosynthesis